LSGFTQGDGSHLPGRTLTLNAANWQPVAVSDDDSYFADNDGGQVLTSAQTLFGTAYAAGRAVEAEYTLTVRAPDGTEYTIIGFNISEPGSPYASYGTIEGLAFVGPPGSWPPTGTPLTVLGASEGPANTGGAGSVGFAQTVAPICFVTGTRILTPDGYRPVETLETGDLVETRDRGAQPLLWAGRTMIGGTSRVGRAEFRPVGFKTGSLARDLPLRPLWVSRQHRMLLGGWRAEMHFGATEVLVAAGALAGHPGIALDDQPGRWSYHHLLTPQHEILTAEGVPCESFLPTEYSISLLSPAMRLSLLAALPALGHGTKGYGPPARPIVKRWELPVLA
jgi:hypothetical protein